MLSCVVGIYSERECGRLVLNLWLLIRSHNSDILCLGENIATCICPSRKPRHSAEERALNLLTAAPRTGLRAYCGYCDKAEEREPLCGCLPLGKQNKNNR